MNRTCFIADDADLDLADHTLSVGGGVAEACLQVRAIRDNIYESEEVVTILVYSEDSAVTVHDSPISIIIKDLDTGIIHLYDSLM